MYRKRMNGYYPQVIQSILEFQAIIDGEYPEINELSVKKSQITDNAYLTTMSEDRIKQWEEMLNIQPIEGSTFDDRRDTIIARIRGQGKLNTSLINTIVNTFTGGTATSWIENSVLYVEITPPPNNKQYQFENVKQELAKKVPAHLGFQISRNYYSWGEVQSKCSTWQVVKDEFNTWEDVVLYVPFS